ncbi:hypothetical protein PAXRUDRAFT_145702, partial [Paxillus rubicundulus Ve08.2h10]
CEGHKPYNQQLKPPKKGQTQPKTSAINAENHFHHNLTLSKWLQVVAYHDQHQPISQEEVVKLFTNEKAGALIFMQSTLSHHLSKEGHAADKWWLKSHPTALSSKQIRVEALSKWVKHMEEKGEHVAGPMLVAKCEKFKKALDVPKNGRLKSGGWATNLC